jgi:hypothetical protein
MKIVADEIRIGDLVTLHFKLIGRKRRKGLSKPEDVSIRVTGITKTSIVSREGTFSKKEIISATLERESE